MTANVDLLKFIIDQGCTVFIFVLVLVFAFRLANRFFPQFLQTQQDIAAAMGRQAECMGQMRDTVHDFVTKDNSEHREILLGLQVVGQELKALVNEVTRLGSLKSEG